MARGKEPRVLVVGCGRHARNAHLPLVGEHPHAVLAGVVDTNGEQAHACKEEFGAETWHTDYRSALEQVGPDIVLVVTPPSTHSEIAVSAILHRARVVFVEKPPALDVVGATAVAQVAEANGAIVEYGFKYAYHQPAANEFFANDGLGVAYTAIARWLRRRGQDMTHWDPSTMKAQFGGGVIPDLFLHLMERVCAWTNTWTATSVTANAWTYTDDGLLRPWDPDGIEVDHRATGIVELDGGPRVDWRLTWRGAAIEEDQRVEINLVGERGVAFVPWMTDEPDPGRFRAKLYRGEGEPLTLGEQSNDGWDWWPWRRSGATPTGPLTEHQIYSAQFDHLLDCYYGRAEPIVDARKGQQLQLLQDAALRSAANDGAEGLIQP